MKKHRKIKSVLSSTLAVSVAASILSPIAMAEEITPINPPEITDMIPLVPATNSTPLIPLVNATETTPQIPLTPAEETKEDTSNLPEITSFSATPASEVTPITFGYEKLIDVQNITGATHRVPAVADKKLVIFFDDKTDGNAIEFTFTSEELPAGSYTLKVKGSETSTRSDFEVYNGDTKIGILDQNDATGDKTDTIGELVVGDNGATIKFATFDGSNVNEYNGKECQLVIYDLIFEQADPITKADLGAKIDEAKAITVENSSSLGYENLQLAIASAEIILADESATEVQISEAIAMLDEAILNKDQGYLISVTEVEGVTFNVKNEAVDGEIVSVSASNIPEGKWVSAIEIYDENATKIGEVIDGQFTMPNHSVTLKPILSDLATHTITVSEITGVTLNLSQSTAKSGTRIVVSYDVTDDSKYVSEILANGEKIEEDMTFVLGDEDVTVTAVLADKATNSRVVDDGTNIIISQENYEIDITKSNFAYSLKNTRTGDMVAEKHDESGIVINNNDVIDTELLYADDFKAIFDIETNLNKARVVMNFEFDHVNFELYPYDAVSTDTEVVKKRITCASGEPAYLISNESIDLEKYEITITEDELAGLDSASGAGAIIGYTDMSNYINIRKIDGGWPIAKIEVLEFTNGKVTKTNIGTCEKETVLTIKVDGTKASVYDEENLLGEFTNEEPITGKVGYRSYKAQTYISSIVVNDLTGDTPVSLISTDDYTSTRENFKSDGTGFFEEGGASGGALGKKYFKMEFQTKGVTEGSHLAPVYGLGDNGGWGTNANLAGRTFDNIMNNGGSIRFVSNFAIFPEQRLAEVLFDSRKKIAAFTESENMTGVASSPYVDGMYYFFGSLEDELEDIYKTYKDVRNAEGYLDAEPIYDYFGVGFEGYGAMGWAVAEETMIDYVGTYLDRGYNLKWGVLGSGFWKGARAGGSTTSSDLYQGGTTSFGYYDNGLSASGAEESVSYEIRYPHAPTYDDISTNFDDDPTNDVSYEEMFGEGSGTFQEFFNENNVKTIFGMRINFKAESSEGGYYKEANDGDWMHEGLEKGYFLTDENGEALTFNFQYIPTGKAYALDSSNPEAVAWYKEATEHWFVDGWKEDTMIKQSEYNNYDGNIGIADYYLCYDENENGLLVRNDTMEMVRNAAYSLPGDILRINDTSSGEPGRFVVNTSAYAASGIGNVYPDIVGANFQASNIGNAGYQNFLARNAISSALMPSVSLGNLPWGSNNPLEYAVLNAMNWHSTYQAYIYDAAHDSWETGYPHSYNPLYLAYPDDDFVEDRFTRNESTFEWLIGESLLAAPIFDNTTSSMYGNRGDTRDVYLPAGSKWMDMNTGEVYEGGQELQDVVMPLDTMPVYVGNKAIIVREEWQDFESTTPEQVDGVTPYGYVDKSALYNDLFADVYPISPEGTVYEFIYPYSPEENDDGYFEGSEDALQKSVITNEVPDGAWDNTRIKVMSSTGEEIPFTVHEMTGALSFKLTENVDYTVILDDESEPETPPTTARPRPTDDDTDDNTDVDIEDGETPLTETPEEELTAYEKLTDVSDHWGKDAIKYVVENALMNGISDTEFAPNLDMSRAMIWTVLYRLDGNTDETGDIWYEKAMVWAMENKISDGTNPMDSITREQLVTMLWRYYGSEAPKNETDISFEDWDTVSDYAKDAMMWAYETGVITGKTDKTINPADTATRAEVATILERILNK